MPFQNVQNQYQPPQSGLNQALGAALQLYAKNQAAKTPALNATPDQTMALGQNQIPLGQTQGQMNPNQFMQAGGMPVTQPNGLMQYPPQN